MELSYGLIRITAQSAQKAEGRTGRRPTFWCTVAGMAGGAGTTSRPSCARRGTRSSRLALQDAASGCISPDTLLGCEWDDVRLQNGDLFDERGARYREPEHTTENWPERSRAFSGVLVACRRCHCDRLCVDHFAHDAARRVRRGRQDGVQVELFGGNALQAAKQSVGRCVRARQEDAE